jgi:hypothetical protein
MINVANQTSHLRGLSREICASAMSVRDTVCIPHGSSRKTACFSPVESIAPA